MKAKLNECESNPNAASLTNKRSCLMQPKDLHRFDSNVPPRSASTYYTPLSISKPSDVDKIECYNLRENRTYT